MKSASPVEETSSTMRCQVYEKFEVPEAQREILESLPGEILEKFEDYCKSHIERVHDVSEMTKSKNEELKEISSNMEKLNAKENVLLERLRRHREEISRIKEDEKTHVLAETKRADLAKKEARDCESKVKEIQREIKLTMEDTKRIFHIRGGTSQVNEWYTGAQ